MILWFARLCTNKKKNCEDRTMMIFVQWRKKIQTPKRPQVDTTTHWLLFDQNTNIKENDIKSQFVHALRNHNITQNNNCGETTVQTISQLQKMRIQRIITEEGPERFLVIHPSPELNGGERGTWEI